MKARAVVHEAVGVPPVVEELDVADVVGDEVLVRVHAAGICHTDVSCTNGTLGLPAPAVLGHEGAGVVEEVGPDVRGVSVGDRVVVSVVHNCGRCSMCERGFTAQCVERGLGRPRLARRGEPVTQMFGTATFSEVVLVRERSVVVVPDAVPLDVAAVTGCAVITGAGAVLRVAKVVPGQTVAVVGCGGVGLSAVMAAAASGAARVIAVDPAGDRRHLALEVGATDACEPTLEAVRGLIPGGCDVVCEAAGAPGAAELAIGAAAAAGTIVLMGIPDPSTTVPLAVFPVILAEQTIVGCNMGRVRPTVDFARLFALHLDGRLPVDRLITHRFGLDDAVAAFDAATSPGSLRVMLTPTRS